MVLFTIPVYFALHFAVENEYLEKQIYLERYVLKMEKYISSPHTISQLDVRVKTALIDTDNKIIINNLSQELENYQFKFFQSYPYLYYKKAIIKNDMDIKYIVCEIEMNYSKIMLLAIVLFYIILINIYLLNKSIIRNISKPYEIMQKYTTVLFNDTMHELKTPIGIIKFNLDLLERKESSNKYTTRMKTALKQVQINYEAIEYYIKNKRITYPKERINLTEFLEQRVDFFDEMAKIKSMEIKTSIEKELFVFINSLELQRIIDNTIINAIKYSKPKKNIEISLKSNLDEIILSIKDYGVGIKDTKSIFQRFIREDETQGGFGLGLNIIKTICDKNSIKIKLLSKEDVGSTFIYTFKLDRKKFLDRLEDE